MIIRADARHIPLSDNSIDCIVCSPPYWGQRKYDGESLSWDAGAWYGQLGLEPTPDLYIRHLVGIFSEVRRVLKPAGTCWIVISDSRPSNRGAGGRLRSGDKQWTNHGSHGSHLGGQVGRPTLPDGLKYSDMLGLPHDVVKALRADGWYWRDEIIWSKTNGMPEPTRSRTTRTHEYVFLLTKSPSPKYYFDYRAIREPATCERVRGPATYQHVPNGGNNDGLARRKSDGWRRKRSVWSVPVLKARGTKHYATFPEKLIEPMILAGCPEGGLVLDPFAGSGTTGVVAGRLGRRCVLIDMAYQELQKERLETLCT